MRWFRFAALLVFATLLQAGLLSNLRYKPDLLLILVVFFSIYCSTYEAIITSFTIGFAYDLIGQSMGPGIIAFGIFGTLLAYLHRVIAIRKMPYQAGAILAIGFLSGISIYYLSLAKGAAHNAGIYKSVFAASIYSGIVGPFLFLPTAWWMRIKTHRFTRS